MYEKFNLPELLNLQKGITSIIGGGGKTTLLYTLGKALSISSSPSAQDRVLLCTTTRMYPYPDLPFARNLSELDRLSSQSPLLCAGTLLSDTNKITMPDFLSFSALSDRFDYILIEADGSAQKPLKAHAPYEPVIPPESNQTILLIGASGFGQPISQATHRPERYAQLAGVPIQTTASPETEAAVLIAEGLPDRIFINQVESPPALIMAKRLAKLVSCPVLAGSLWKGVYVRC